MTVLASDSFNRANGALGTTDSYNGGSPTTWVNLIGSMAVSNNQATSSNTSDSAAYVDVGQSDVTISTQWVNPVGNDYFIRNYFRITDSNNYYRLDYYSASSSNFDIRLLKNVGGTLSTVTTWTSATQPTSPFNVKIGLSGSTITVSLNGTQIINSTNNTFNQTATKHGISAYKNTVYLDNFEVDSLVTQSGTTYIGSGTSQGTSSVTSNETLILSSNENTQGLSTLTTSETVISHSGTTYSGSGDSIGIVSLRTSETIVYPTNGTILGRSSLLSQEKINALANGQSNGKSSLITNETVIGHSSTIYNASGSSRGLSSLTSNDRTIYNVLTESNGQSQTTSNEMVIYFVSGVSDGKTLINTNEAFISKLQIVSHVTLQGKRELHVKLEGQRELHISLKGSRELHVILQGGVDLPAQEQDFTLEAGTDKIIDITGVTDSVASLDLTLCTEVHYEAKRGEKVISKDLTNGIKVTSPTDLSINLVPNDSHLFSGVFHHEVWCVDSNNKKCVLMEGSLTIKPSYADVQ